jgi:hypothetical protein
MSITVAFPATLEAEAKGWGRNELGDYFRPAASLAVT